MVTKICCSYNNEFNTNRKCLIYAGQYITSALTIYTYVGMAEQQLRRTFNHIERNAVSDYSKARFGACNLNHCYAQPITSKSTEDGCKRWKQSDRGQYTGIEDCGFRMRN